MWYTHLNTCVHIQGLTSDTAFPAINAEGSRQILAKNVILTQSQNDGNVLKVNLSVYVKGELKTASEILFHQ